MVDHAKDSAQPLSADLCPICHGTEFGAYRGRPRSQCASCGSKERHRFLALVLREHLVRPPAGLPVYHFAPERSIAAVLRELFGTDYRPADLSPERYGWSEVPLNRIDLSKPLEYLQPGSVGGFVHSHVLEHIPASIDRVIREMNEALAPDGFHIFQVPVHRGWYREDMDPELDADERNQRFHQEDHMRQFGDRDFEERVLDLFDSMDRVDPGNSIDEEMLKRAAIPASAMTRNTGHTVYVFRKPKTKIS